jgi:hypothetical protein
MVSETALYYEYKLNRYGTYNITLFLAVSVKPTMSEGVLLRILQPEHGN